MRSSEPALCFRNLSPLFTSQVSSKQNHLHRILSF
jgi:hypothetical protein